MSGMGGTLAEKKKKKKNNRFRDRLDHHGSETPGILEL